MSLYLNFNDHIILVNTTIESLQEKLQHEFHYFLSEYPNPDGTVNLKLEAPPEIPSLLAKKILETAVVYQMGHRQYVDYFGEALTIWDKQDNTISVYSQNESLLFELGFLAVHSMLGQLLDKSGIARIHALGVAVENVNAVVMLPSKGGKSTLLSNLLENPEVQIIADDMPLIDHEGLVHPFPTKISLDKLPVSGPLSKLEWHEFKRAQYPAKWTTSLSSMKSKIATDSYKNKTLLIAGFRLSHGESIITKVSKWKMISPLLEHMIVGLGLPQIIELFLRFDWTDIFKMMRHGFLRTYCALRLLQKSEAYFIYLGPDKPYNAQLILDTLYEHQAK